MLEVKDFNRAKATRAVSAKIGQSQRAPAEAAGVAIGDLIVCVNGSGAKSTDLLAKLIFEACQQGDKVLLTVLRDPSMDSTLPAGAEEGADGDVEAPLGD